MPTPTQNNAGIAVTSVTIYHFMCDRCFHRRQCTSLMQPSASRDTTVTFVATSVAIV